MYEGLDREFSLDGEKIIKKSKPNTLTVIRSSEQGVGWVAVVELH